MDIEKSFSQEKYEVIHSVQDDSDGLRLDQFLMNFLPSFSRQNIKKKITSGDVTILGRPHPHKASTKVYSGERVQIVTHRDNLEDEYWRGEKIDIQFDPDIIYEDKELVVMSKPPYMATHPTGRHLFNCATVYFQTKLGHPMHSIHRLDRETSGVQLLGKSPQAANKFTTYFEEDKVLKCYFLISKKDKTVEFPIVAKERLGQQPGFVPNVYNHSTPEDDHSQGKHAQTTYFELYQDDTYIIAIAHPKTGRQHQIRSHAAYHGLPLLGDKLYSGDPEVFRRFKDLKATDADHDLMDLHRHALHAIALKLPGHNIFRAPLPNDLIDWISRTIPSIDLTELNEKIDKRLKSILEVD